MEIKTTGVTQITKTTEGSKHFNSQTRVDKGLPRMTNTSNQQETTNMHHTFQAPHHFQINTGTKTRHQDGPHNLSSTSRHETTWTETGENPENSKEPTKTKMQDTNEKLKINIIAETLNCHGFAQNSEYVINRLNSCNILCLTETWIWPHEINLVSDTICNHPNTKNSSQEYTVISKCGMHDREPDYSGRGYGGVTVIVKNNAHFSIK